MIVLVLVAASAVLYLHFGPEQATIASSTSSSVQGGGGSPANFYPGSLPFLTVSPENRTFSISLEVTTLVPVSLGYDAASSYAVEFSNGTLWVYSPECNSGVNNSTSSSGGWPPGTDICSFAADNYLPENGRITNPSVNLTASGTWVTVNPTNLPSNFSGNITLTIHVGLPPGTYSLYVALDVGISGGAPSPWAIPPAPLVVLSGGSVTF